MDERVIFLALVGAAILSAEAASAQSGCSEDARVGVLGVTAIECLQCENTDVSGKPIRFMSEPLVLEVGPPAASVLRPGDVIVAVNDHPITTVEASRVLGRSRPGERVELAIRRADRVFWGSFDLREGCPGEDFKAVLRPGEPWSGEEPAGVVPDVPPTPARDTSNVVRIRSWGGLLGFGLRCEGCSSRVYETPEGMGVHWQFPDWPEVISVSPGTAAWDAGLRPGDVLREIDGIDITTTEGGRLFGSIHQRDRVSLTVMKDDREVRIAILARGDAEAPSELEDPAFSRRIGNVQVEVRGTVTGMSISEDESVVVIRVGDTEIRLQVSGSGQG